MNEPLYPYKVFEMTTESSNGDVYRFWIAESLSLKGCAGQGDTERAAIQELAGNEIVWLETAMEFDIAIPERKRSREMNRPEILDAAKSCVCGQREQDYGSPENNFERIANLWNAYLGELTVNAVDVAMMLGLLKIARIKTGKGTADSFVDLAGYAACGGEIATQQGGVNSQATRT